MIEWLTYSSLAIKGFPMGDAHERSFPVYLPPNYHHARSEPYPVIFILSGFGSRGAAYTFDESPFKPHLPTLLDKAILAGEMLPAVVVFPDCTSKLGCSQYINSPALGQYQDYVAEELVSLIESRFHVHKIPEFRGIAGHSSGGFGAMVMGMQRPDVFKFICSSAGDSFFNFLFMKQLLIVQAELESAGGVANFLDLFLNSPNPGALGGNKFDAMFMIAMAPCYAPNLKNAPLLGDLFIDLKTGVIIDEIWQKYMAWDPINMLPHYVENLRSLKWIHLDAGSDDEYGLHLGQRQFALGLDKHKIPYHLNEYPGRHSGHTWRYVDRLKLMLKKMVA